MRLSVLDQSPVPSGSTPAQALAASVALARAAERLGYHRFWLAEHHGTPGLAGTTPEVLAAAVAAATSTIRVGSGGVLLSHYSPLKVAETFRVLSQLFPGRIDLGLGRADGASAATAAALRAGVDGAAAPFGQKLAELLARLNDGVAHPARAHDPVSAGTAPAGEPAFPLAADGPQPWLLASSADGAGAAAAHGLPLCFAHFISTGFGPQIVARYRRAFQPGPARPWSEASVAVAVVCAPTDEEAERLAASLDVWKLDAEDGRGPVPTPEAAAARGPVPTPEAAAARPRTALEAATIAQRRKGLLVGAPDRAADALRRLAVHFDVEELMILTVCHDPAARLRSYQLLAEAFELTRRPAVPADP